MLESRSSWYAASALTLVLTAGLLGGSLGAASGDPWERVLIRAPKPYTSLVARIESMGGKVTYRYKYVDAIAAEIPRASLPAVRQVLAPGAITKDEVIDAPASVDTTRGKPGLPAAVSELDVPSETVDAVAAADLPGLAAASPTAYLINNSIANVAGQHAAGYTGEGVLVAVIDSGIRPGFPHISLDGSVVGCEDFVGDGLGCSNVANGGHGTFVAGMISANVVFGFSAASSFRNAVLANCPSCFLNPPTNTQIPMLGTAPLSSIYALRVFGPTGGAPTSRILAAVERVIELRELYNAGDSAGQNIQVCNMSLGGSTVFAGRDLFDTTVDVMLERGIVPTISAGNAGPSSLTVGSPGTSRSAITVGAASLTHNERILRYLQFGPVNGPKYRPFDGYQTAYFSSRGPNADGRLDPDVTMSGFASYGQGFSSDVLGITIGSGTSFAAPSVAGVAAVLRQRFPGATARQVRTAIIASANPFLLADGSTVLDQGAGYVDAGAAAALLASGSIPDALPASPGSVKSVKVNVEKGSGLYAREGVVQEIVTDLQPGQRHDIVYRVLPNTSQVIVTLSEVTPSLPLAQQNVLFGDDILLAVHSAKTSAIGEGDYPVFEFTTGGSFVVNNPETGLMRITVNGDWTNAGTISAHVNVFSLVDPIPQFTGQGKIGFGQALAFPVKVPAGVAKAEFRLGWREDWSNYPTSDVDMILVRPDGSLLFGGATLNNPEVVTIDAPAQGQWIVLIDGFEVWTGTDNYELRVALDGKVIR